MGGVLELEAAVLNINDDAIMLSIGMVAVRLHRRPGRTVSKY